MQNNRQRSLDILNALVHINNCRIEGYDQASKETEGYTLKSLFTRLADTSRACKHELSNEIKKLGALPKDRLDIDAEIYYAWQEVKTALATRNRKALLNSCEKGESVAEKAYQEALDKIEVVDMDHRILVKKQYSLIRSDHEKIRNLRNALLAFN
jgi:uncharacterized protein (TIGR02284 family)